MDIIAIVQGFVNQYPILASIIMIMGILRAINKPIFAVLHAYVLATPSANDDKILDNVEQSKIYTSLAFALDWVSSIKLK